MKYLLLLSSLELGGAERQAVNFATYLKNNGHQVSIMGISKSGRVNELCEEYNIDCQSLKMDLDIGDICKMITNIFFDKMWSARKRSVLSKAYALKKFLRKQQFDVCIAYCTLANNVLGMTKKIWPQPVCVWYQRDAGVYDDVKGISSIAIKYVDYVLANSRVGQEWIKKAYNKDAIIILNGVVPPPPMHSVGEWRNKLNASQDTIVCTMIANLSSKKNHISLLKIWSILVAEGMGNKYKLVFAGRFDDQYEFLRNYVVENNLVNNVIFLGPVKDVTGLCRATDICVFGAKSEGSPNGIIECTMEEKPVVATDLPEIRDVVSSVNYKYLFTDDNINYAVDRLIELGRNKELRDKIGEANKNKALMLYDPNKNFEKIVKMFA